MIFINLCYKSLDEFPVCIGEEDSITLNKVEK